MNRRRLLLIATLAWVALLAAACSGAATAPIDDAGNRIEAPFGAPVAAPTAAPVAAPTSASNAYGSDKPGTQALPDQQLIIYTGSLELEVTDVDAAVNQAEQLIRGLGGHVATSQASDTDRGKFATVTYRIPVEHWSDALAGLKALASRVVDANTSSEDVTAQVVDLDARLANLRVTEAALQTIMDRATTITDVLKVQTELTGVRGDIESLTAQRDLLANQAALATLEVSYNTPPVAEVSRQSESWNLGTEVDNALAALVRVGQGALSLIIWLVIVIVPLFVPIVIVIYLAFLMRRRWLRNHPPLLAAQGGPQGGPWPPSA